MSANAAQNSREERHEATFKLIAFTCLTSGLYLIHRYSTWRQSLQSYCGKEVVSGGLYLAYMITAGLGLLVKAMALGVATAERSRETFEAAILMSGISQLLALVSWILLIILAFQVKGALQEKLGRPLSGAGTFFFNAFYLNYALRCADEQTSAPAGIHNSAEQLERYAAMLEKGLLTREEFDAKKKALLS